MIQNPSNSFLRKRETERRKRLPSFPESIASGLGFNRSMILGMFMTLLRRISSWRRRSHIRALDSRRRRWRICSNCNFIIIIINLSDQQTSPLNQPANSAQIKQRRETSYLESGSDRGEPCVD